MEKLKIWGAIGRWDCTLNVLCNVYIFRFCSSISTVCSRLCGFAAAYVVTIVQN
jgi:hypothetical protein